MLKKNVRSFKKEVRSLTRDYPKNPHLSAGESVEYAFLSNFPLVKNVCEKEFSGVWLSWVMLGWDQGPNLT